jgi:hypothetical protein
MIPATTIPATPTARVRRTWPRRPGGNNKQDRLVIESTFGYPDCYAGLGNAITNWTCRYEKHMEAPCLTTTSS